MTVPMADGKEPAPPATNSATPHTASTEASTPETTPPVMAAVESPPLAPAVDEPGPAFEPTALAPEVRAEIRESAGEPSSAETTSSIAPSSLTGGWHMPKLSRRARWRGMIAATIAFAAGIGALAGAIAAGTRPPPPPAPVHDEVAASERAAMQKTIARLTKDVTTLRANLEAATKSANTQLAKLNERVSEKAASEKQAERHAAAAAASQDITGSVGAPAAAAAVPVPTPRPVVQVDAKPDVKPVETRPAIVEGWAIRSVRDGVALLENRGEIYEVVPGAPLPGLGRVEAVRRQDGRWVVVTPKGLIVAARTPAPRAYYERF
ncbi:MAG: hypothetical protein ACTHLY_21405 [Pseudolabrys sp.]